jgi:carbonic anhydrase
MKKLVRGILDFRRNVLPAYRMTYQRLAKSQTPDCLLVACADSRVAPNTFASTVPGDMFVVRNVGNLVPPCQSGPAAPQHSSTGAALEFAVLKLEVRDLIVCGHSNCGAMRAVLEGTDQLPEHLRTWLDSVGRAETHGLEDCPDLGAQDQLSQRNVLQQLEHALSYPFVQERVAAGKLSVHGWWFDIGTAEVLAYEPGGPPRFQPIDEELAERLYHVTDD